MKKILFILCMLLPLGVMAQSDVELVKKYLKNDLNLDVDVVNIIRTDSVYSPYGNLALLDKLTTNLFNSILDGTDQVLTLANSSDKIRKANQVLILCDSIAKYDHFIDLENALMEQSLVDKMMSELSAEDKEEVAKIVQEFEIDQVEPNNLAIYASTSINNDNPSNIFFYAYSKPEISHSLYEVNQLSSAILDRLASAKKIQLEMTKYKLKLEQ